MKCAAEFLVDVRRPTSSRAVRRSMLGIGCPDRHALRRITPIKCTDRELRSPPARAGSFFGASQPFATRLAKVGVCHERTVRTTVRNCTRDEGGPFEIGSQVQVSSHRKLPSSRAMVVSVAETSGRDPGRRG